MNSRPFRPTWSQRELVQIQLRASAALNMQLAAAMLGKDQDELRKHFQSNAELMMLAHKELDKPNG